MTAASGLGWPAVVSVVSPTGLGWPHAGRQRGPVPRETDEPERERSAAVTAHPDEAQDPVAAGHDAAKETPGAGEALAGQDGPAAAGDTPIAAAARVAVRLRAPATGDAFARPARTRVIVVANQKGGVGKTTTTVNLGAALALHGQRVLVVDLDPQGNASTALGVHHAAGSASVYDSVIDGRELGAAVQDSPGIAGLRVVPATIDLAGAEIELVPMVARELRLRRAITAHLAALAEEERPDYVLIDCPPSLGLLTLNALVAAEEVLIPIQCEYYALEGLGQLVQTIDMVTGHLNAGLTISTILLTMYDARTRLAAQVADEVRAHFADRVLSTAIPRSVRVSEAPSYGQTVLTYDPGSSGSLSYVEAARELAASLPR